jgi:iron complex outermembrane recepter protein
MKNLLFVLVVLLPISLIGQVGQIQGKVVDNSTKQPVVGALIVLNDASKTRSDLDGKYNFKDLPYGTYSMKIIMLSFDTMTVELTLDQPSLMV